MTTALEEDSETAGNVTGLSQGQRIQTFTCLIVGMIVALYYSWQVGLIAISCIPLIIGGGILRAKFGKREGSVTGEGNYVSPATLLERSFHDIVVLQAYGNQDKASAQYAQSLEPDVEFKKKKSMMDGLAFGASQFSVFGTFALIFWAGIKLVSFQLSSYCIIGSYSSTLLPSRLCSRCYLESLDLLTFLWRY